MKFELKIYNTNSTEEELISDLKKIANELGKTTLTSREYDQSKINNFHSNTLSRKFKGWNNALKKAGLEIKHNFTVPLTDLIEDIKRVAQEISPDKLSAEKYNELGKFSASSVRPHFGTWNKTLEKIGLDLKKQQSITEKSLFENLEQVWIKLGRQPGRREMIKPISNYSEQPYIKKYGSWLKALKAFVEYINSDIDETEIIESKSNTLATEKVSKYIHKTKRDPNDRLKLKVMWRDGNVCRICGCKLSVWTEGHFDHIKPWSKGGETTLENLQILCAKCNFAKGNYDIQYIKGSS